MNDTDLRQWISEIASDSKNVILTQHASERMVERDITLQQVLQTLRKGHIDEPAHLDIRNNWKCTLRRVVSGKIVKVAAAVTEQGTTRIVVITVITHE